MIRFSAFLVVVAVGLLVAGVVTSKLLLVYIAIGVSGVALLALGIGAAVNWRELTGKTAETSAQGPAAQAAAPEAATSQAQPSQAQPPQVPVPAGSAPAPARRSSPGSRAIRAPPPPRHPPDPAGPPRPHRPLLVRPGPVTCPPPSRLGPSPSRARVPSRRAHARMTCRVPPPRSPRAASRRHQVSGSFATTPFRSRPPRKPPRRPGQRRHRPPAGRRPSLRPSGSPLRRPRLPRHPSRS